MCPAEAVGAGYAYRLGGEKQVDYINTHGTSTPVGDVKELRAGDHCVVGLNVLRKLSSVSDALMASLTKAAPGFAPPLLASSRDITCPRRPDADTRESASVGVHISGGGLLCPESRAVARVEQRRRVKKWAR